MQTYMSTTGILARGLILADLRYAYRETYVAAGLKTTPGKLSRSGHLAQL